MAKLLLLKIIVVLNYLLAKTCIGAKINYI